MILPPLSRQRLSLYVCDWQRLRMMCKGNWADESGTQLCFMNLDLYITDGQKIDDKAVIKGEYKTRLYRVVNMLDAVYMGWKNKGSGSSHENMFLAYKNKASSDYWTAQLDKTAAWSTVADPTMIREQWNALDVRMRKDIVADLRQRWNKTVKKEIDKGESATEAFEIVLENRPELFWFMSIVAPGVLKKPT